jgi:hypothetical protein
LRALDTDDAHVFASEQHRQELIDADREEGVGEDGPHETEPPAGSAPRD